MLLPEPRLPGRRTAPAWLATSLHGPAGRRARLSANCRGAFGLAHLRLGRGGGAADGVLAGLAPALESVKVNITGWLKGHSGVFGTGGTRRLQGVPVSAQVAMSMALLVGAALFARAEDRAANRSRLSAAEGGGRPAVLSGRHQAGDGRSAIACPGGAGEGAPGGVIRRLFGKRSPV